MRIWISAPHIGPLRTTLRSSGHARRSGGKVLAAIFLVPALFLLALQFRHWPFDAAVAVMIVLAMLGRYAQRREARRCPGR